jgi:hypothetical protein
MGETEALGYTEEEVEEEDVPWTLILQETRI